MTGKNRKKLKMCVALWWWGVINGPTEALFLEGKLLVTGGNVGNPLA